MIVAAPIQSISRLYYDTLFVIDLVRTLCGTIALTIYTHYRKEELACGTDGSALLAVGGKQRP
jgi:hypothetical protein